MKKENRKRMWIGFGLLGLFIFWTVLIRVADVKAIGPRGSSVGLATINCFVNKLIGVNMHLYVITDWLGLVPICLIVGFGIFGLCLWIKRKKLLSVDFDILALGVFYIIVMAAYAFFEIFVVNYRPILINGVLEASYPSSTTMLAMCVIPTAVMQFKTRIKNGILRKSISIVLIVFAVFMVVGRVVSGVHWISDIIGGMLFSSGVVALYGSVKDIE